MKIVNYNRSLVSKTMELLERRVADENKDRKLKHRIAVLIKTIILVLLALTGVIGVCHTLEHVHGAMVGIATLIVLTAVTCALLFSIVISEPKYEDWELFKTFEMHYYDIDSKGKLVAVEKHNKRDEIVLTYLDKNKYAQYANIPLNDIVFTPTVEEDVLDVSRGILLRHYEEGPGIHYVEEDYNLLRTPVTID